MGHVERTPEALLDIRGIALHIAADNPDAASKMVARTGAAIRALCDSAENGAANADEAVWNCAALFAWKLRGLLSAARKRSGDFASRSRSTRSDSTGVSEL